MNILYVFPNFEASIIRSNAFIKELNKNIKSIQISTISKPGKTFFRLRENSSNLIIRLIFEIFCGLELFLRVSISKSDLIIFSSPPYFPILISSFAAILFKKKFVLDLRDNYPDVLFDLNVVREKSIAGKILIFLTKKIYKHAAMVFTVTPALENQISKYVSCEKIKLIKNGFDENLFKPSREKYPVFTVVYHGIMGKLHDIDLLKKIAQSTYAKNKNINFLIVGSGPKKKILEMEKPPNLIYLGKKEYTEIPSIISKAHIGISPIVNSDLGKSTYPLKIFEYIGSGLPVIAIPKGGLGDIVDSEKLGFQFNNEEIDNIVDKIIDLAENQSAYKQMQINTESLKKKFTRQESAKFFSQEISRII